MALKFHPDKNKEPGAENKFKVSNHFIPNTLECNQ